MNSVGTDLHTAIVHGNYTITGFRGDTVWFKVGHTFYRMNLKLGCNRVKELYDDAPKFRWMPNDIETQYIIFNKSKPDERTLLNWEDMFLTGPIVWRGKNWDENNTETKDQYFYELSKIITTPTGIWSELTEIQKAVLYQCVNPNVALDKYQTAIKAYEMETNYTLQRNYVTGGVTVKGDAQCKLEEAICSIDVGNSTEANDCDDGEKDTTSNV